MKSSYIYYLFSHGPCHLSVLLSVGIFLPEITSWSLLGVKGLISQNAIIMVIFA